MGEPGGVVATLPPGAGLSEEGDASLQGPAREKDQAQIETLPAQPKPTNPKKPANPEAKTATSADEASAVIELAARTTKPKAAEVTAVPRERDGQVTVRAKPEKRKNAKERAKEKYAKKYGKKGAEDGTTPDTTAKAKSKAEQKADKAQKPEKKDKAKKARFGR